MKKISLLLVLFLFGCQSLNESFERTIKGVETSKQTKEIPTPSPIQTPSQLPFKGQPTFGSGNLGIQKANEKKIQVALFLPISGKNKDLGLSLFNSAIMSLFDNDFNHNIELVLIDSKDTPNETAKAFEEIVNRKIKIVIGPVFSSSIEAIEKSAKQNQITVISLSNNEELAGKINDDGGVFLAGILPESQIDKIVSYSLQRGKFSFAIIAPNNQYGNTITTLFKKTVKNRDGNFITSEFYKTNDPDIDHVVNRAITSFSIPNRLKTKKGNVIVNESDRTYAQVIMVPESGKILSKIIASIKKQNLDERDFQIIGTSQWSDISTLNDRNLIGAWFAAPQNEKFREFEKVYYQSYNKFPPRISSITYDLVGAISQLIDFKRAQIQREQTPNIQTLSVKDFSQFSGSPKNGFDGIDGLFRFLPNGLVQRNLAVLQVGNGRFETIEKPAEQFLKY